jgi:pimeloyl-ACP methyl ester carboxylesterase
MNSITEIKNPNKMLWEKGDFTKIAQTMRDSGAALVASLGVTKNMKVLDLGCGDGTTAIPAARLGADVLGVDIASNLVAAGNDLTIPPHQAETLAGMVPGAALTRLPGLGHLAHEEAPRRIAALILALARAHRRAGRPGAPTGDAR